MLIHIDFETRGVISLPKHGVYAYVDDPNTSPWCMGYYVSDGTENSIKPEDVKIWVLGEPFPADLQELLGPQNPDVRVGAHNAQFEYAVWNHICVPRYGWPPLKAESMDCTMARAYTRGYSPALKDVCAQCGLADSKDEDGHNLMMVMCKPKSAEGEKLAWWDDDDKKQRLYEYCIQDVVVEVALSHALPKLSEIEQKIFALDLLINEKGVGVDLETAKKAHKSIEEIVTPINDEVVSITGGAVQTAMQSNALRNWCNVRIRGADITAFSADAIQKELENPARLPKNVKRILELRLEAAKYSVLKLKAMLEGAQEEPSGSRLRALFQYHGSRLGRWTGRRLQPHNLPRCKLSETDLQLARLNADRPDILRFLFGSPMAALSSILRSLIVAAPGKQLVSADFVSIEAGILAVLAEAHEISDLLHEGVDIYAAAASEIFAFPVTKESHPDLRFIGKVMFLALQYGGGINAFERFSSGIDAERFYENTFGKATTAEQEKALKEWRSYEQRRGAVPQKGALAFFVSKNRWNKAHPAILEFRKLLEDAAFEAVKNESTVNALKSIKSKIGLWWSCEKSSLYCILPSGREIHYPEPRICPVQTSWGQMKLGLNYMHHAYGKWCRTSTYGAKLSENVCQAVARDILADAMLKLQNSDVFKDTIVSHIHDQIICEVDSANHYQEKMKETLDYEKEPSMMANGFTNWLTYFPVKIDTWEAPHYL